MRVLSLFDGMSCGQIALRDMGITPEVYYASEVDKFAIAQTQLNFPDTIQLGDVRLVDPTQLGHIDLLIGGSPCQSFSFAGKRVGMATKENEKVLTLDRYLELKEQGFEFEGQSYLFWEYMRILTELRRLNPNVKFLLENVKMKKEWETVLTEAIGVPGVHINSALVSAQNRKRIYWTNIGEIAQPEDRGLLLRDVLQTEVDEKYFLKDEVVKNLIAHRERNKAKGYGFGAVFHKGDQKMGALKIGGSGVDDLVEDGYVKISRKGEIRKDQDKASCLTVGGHGAGNHSDMDLICVAMRGRPQCEKNEQQLEPSPDEGKTNCLTTVAKDNLILQRARGFNKGNVFAEKSPTLSSNAWEQNNFVITKEDKPLIIPEATKKGFIEVNEGECFDFAYPDSKTRRGRKMGDKCNALLTSNEFCRYENSRIRRLTPTECARLQTIPEWYTWQCSETQQYKMLGNGWTVEVIKHIFSYLNK